MNPVIFAYSKRSREKKDDKEEKKENQKKNTNQQNKKEENQKNNFQKNNSQKDAYKKDDCKECKKDRGTECKGCICTIIKNFKGKEVFIRTKSGDVLEGTVKELYENNCCITIVSPEMMSPYEPKEVTIISCKDIESLTYQLKEKGN
ncbi:hypothetical protein [Bacillus timonensis]|uniref:hypothetical protein n=1 Tax=Bacillus timonensis TaxID=1033734 RepID=UPI000289961B|nr:hypothetical protein [Bacillus timonensis]